MSFNWISAFGRGVVNLAKRLVGGGSDAGHECPRLAIKPSTQEKGMNVVPLDFGVDKLARTGMAKPLCEPNCLVAVQCPAETSSSPAKADAAPDRKR
jgi:hypothetical protein